MLRCIGGKWKKSNKSINEVREFYHGNLATPDGFFIGDIWGFDGIRFEREHRFIQWLFPIETVSLHNPHAPVLTKKELAELGRDSIVRENAVKSLMFVCEKYGLELSTRNGILFVAPSSNFTGYWLTPSNHNYLRITRILKNLTQLGMGEYSKAFLVCLKELHEKYSGSITKATISYWENAVEEN